MLVLDGEGEVVSIINENDETRENDAADLFQIVMPPFTGLTDCGHLLFDGQNMKISYKCKTPEMIYWKTESAKSVKTEFKMADSGHFGFWPPWS